MANRVEKVTINNPFDISDICSHVVVETDSVMVISEWMPYVSNFTFQFWHKAIQRREIGFSCSSTYQRIQVGTSWDHFVISFTAAEISNIRLELPAGEYWFYNTKAEKGTTATDWSPYPEDVLENLDGTFAAINQTLISHTDSISDVDFKVDRIAESITSKIERTDFEATIEGVQMSMDKINNGSDKWFLSAFEKSDFIDIDPTDQIDDREKYDITVFSLDNAEPLPSIEVMVPDTQGGLLSSVESSNRILYYLTYA